MHRRSCRHQPRPTLRVGLQAHQGRPERRDGCPSVGEIFWRNGAVGEFFREHHEEERVVPLCDEQHRHAACGIIIRLENHEADAAERLLALHRDYHHLERQLDHRALHRRAQSERRCGRSGHHRRWLDRDEVLRGRLEHVAPCRVELRLERPLSGHADAGQVALVEGHHLLPQGFVSSGQQGCRPFGELQRELHLEGRCCGTCRNRNHGILQGHQQLCGDVGAYERYGLEYQPERVELGRHGQVPLELREGDLLQRHYRGAHQAADRGHLDEGRQGYRLHHQLL